MFAFIAFVCEQDGSEVCMKEVPTGESIYSVLTILDLLTVSFPRCREKADRTTALQNYCRVI